MHDFVGATQFVVETTKARILQWRFGVPGPTRSGAARLQIISNLILGVAELNQSNLFDVICPPGISFELRPTKTPDFNGAMDGLQWPVACLRVLFTNPQQAEDEASRVTTLDDQE